MSNFYFLRLCFYDFEPPIGKGINCEDEIAASTARGYLISVEIFNDASRSKFEFKPISLESSDLLPKYLFSLSQTERDAIARKIKTYFSAAGPVLVEILYTQKYVNDQGVTVDLSSSDIDLLKKLYDFLSEK